MPVTIKAVMGPRGIDKRPISAATAPAGSVIKKSTEAASSRPPSSPVAAMPARQAAAYTSPVADPRPIPISKLARNADIDAILMASPRGCARVGAPQTSIEGDVAA